MRDNLTTKFYLHYPQSADTTDPYYEPALPTIYLRITINRKKAELSLAYTLNPKHWDERKQRAKNDSRLNEELTFIEGRILEIKRELQYADQVITARILKDKYLGKDKETNFLCLYYQSHIDKLKKLPHYSKVMIGKHETVLSKIKEYLHSQRLKDILVEQIDYKWINDWDYFLLTHSFEPLKKPLGRNTANKHHNFLKSVLEKAIMEKVLDRNPYNGVNMKSQKSVRDFLTMKEIELIKNHSLAGNSSLHKVRDIFLFSVYTGLRYVDAMSLKTEHVVLEQDDKYWINKIQEKTNERVMTPMLKYAVEIFQKYDDAERQKTGYILPRISNQKVNAYLKTIAEIVGIKKNVTHHMGRHTFATTITLSNEVPLEVVSKWLGHSSIKTSQIYAKITTQYFSKVASKLDDKL